MPGFPPDARPHPRSEWARVRVHPGGGLVDRVDDTLLVVPVLPTFHVERVRELLELVRRPHPDGDLPVREFLDRRPAAETPAFALLVRSGQSLRALRSGAVRIVVDGRDTGRPAGSGLAEEVLADDAWQRVTVTADAEEAPPQDADPLLLDLRDGTVPGAGVTVHRVPSRRTAPPADAAAAPAEGRHPTSSTELRPAVRFRTVALGECALRDRHARPAPARRPPLPLAGAPDEGRAGTETAGDAVLVTGVRCTQGHFLDPDLSTCPSCGAPVPPDARRVSAPRPPLGVVVTDGGTVYTVTGDLLIGREPERAPDVLSGRARPLPLRDAARSTSRVHARLTVEGWRVRLTDEGSANGTSVSRHGPAGPWLPVTPHVPLTLLHGDRLRLGQRQLFFDTWRDTAVPEAVR